MLRSINSIAIALLVFALSSATMAFNFSLAQPPDKSFTKEFTVTPGQLLELDLETGTSIEIEGWDKDLVNIDLTVRGEDADLFEAEFENDSRGVRVSTEYNRRSHDVDCKSRIIVKVPYKFDVDFKTLGGGVEITSVEGNIEGETMGGSLDFTKLKGNLDCQTMGGSISLTDSDVDGKVKTMGGSVSLENINGNVDAQTMGGSISQRNVKGKTTPGAKPLNVSTMGGALKIDDAPNGAKMKTMGGDIRVESVGEFLEAETMGGDIEVKQLDGWIEATTMGGDIEVTMIGDPKKGNRSVFLKSMGGSIDLVVPKGLSMDIDVEIVWTKNHSKPDIKGNLSLEEKVSDDWKDGDHQRYKLVTCEKKINGGNNRIKIKTVNGDVTISEK